MSHEIMKINEKIKLYKDIVLALIGISAATEMIQQGKGVKQAKLMLEKNERLYEELKEKIREDESEVSHRNPFEFIF